MLLEKNILHEYLVDALALMHVKRWEALADGIMDSAVVARTRIWPHGLPASARVPRSLVNLG